MDEQRTHRPTPERHADACAHTAADGYAHPGSAHGHKHAVAGSDRYPCATHIYAHSNPADGNQSAQADVAACIATAYPSADGDPADPAT